MPKASPEHMDARREQILRAALRCFARKGPTETTMSDLFEASGLSAGAVYNYFSGKKDILHAVFELYAEENRASMVAVLARDRPTEGLRDLLLAGLALLDEVPEDSDLRLPLMLHSEALRDPDIAAGARGLYRATVEAFRTAVIQLQASGEIDADWDAEYLCWAALCTFEGWRVMKLVDPHLSTQRFAEAFRRLFHPLLADEGAGGR